MITYGSEDKRCELYKDIILDRKKNVIYIDFVLKSMVDSIDDWYNTNYRDDRWGTAKKAHIFHLARFYNYRRFRNHETIGKEREEFLVEVDLYVQMKRED